MFGVLPRSHEQIAHTVIIAYSILGQLILLDNLWCEFFAATILLDLSEIAI